MKENVLLNTKLDTDKLVHISDTIWEYAETDFEEHKSSSLLAKYLQENGFSIDYPLAHIPTAFIASFGQGQPVIAILGEYDALANMSQLADCTYQSAMITNGNGHGCGHHLLGTASAGAAIAVKQYLEQGNLTGTVKFYGCPAEEGGDGKAHMAKHRLFNNLDAAITWHPGTENKVMSMRNLATATVRYDFNGKSAHAGATPHLGRSALDAVEIMNIGANFLREHIIPEARIHYAITNAGGISPNVVQHEATVEYILRGPNNEVVQDLVKRVNNIAEGAALMTSTKVDYEVISASSNFVLNEPLERVMDECFQELTPPKMTEEELTYAKEIRATLHPSECTSEVALKEQYEEYGYNTEMLFASSDVGDVSWNVPTVQCYTTCFAADTPFHSWQMVSQGKSSIAHKGMMYAAEIMALTAVKLLEQPILLQEAKAFHQKQLNGTVYESLMK